MRIVQTIAGLALLLYGQLCAFTSLRVAVLGTPVRSYGFPNPWPFVLMTLFGLGLAGLGALLLVRAWGGGRQRVDRP